MNLIDIQNKITELLHANFPDFKISTKQKKDVEKPTFFISVDKLKSDNYLRYKYKKVMIFITFVDKEYDHVQNNEINDKLDKLIGIKLYVKGKFLPIYDLNFTESDALICSFTIEYFENHNNELPQDNHSDVMNIMNSKEDLM